MHENSSTWELPPERFLTQEELGAVLLKAHELMDLGRARKRKTLVRDSMIIFCALYTGLRRAEIADLMLKDLSLGNGRSHLTVRRGKNGKSRTVHIGKAFKKLLKDYIAWKAEVGELHPNAYLIRSSKSEKYTPTALWKRWKKYAPNNHRLHDCRHTTAAQLLRAGTSIRSIAQTLGHSRLSTTALYAQAAPDIQQESMNRMEALAHDAMKRVSKASPGRSA